MECAVSGSQSFLQFMSLLHEERVKMFPYFDISLSCLDKEVWIKKARFRRKYMSMVALFPSFPHSGLRGEEESWDLAVCEVLLRFWINC